MYCSKSQEREKKNEENPTNQENENGRIRWLAEIITGDPVQSNGAIVRHPQALPAEPHIGAGPKEGGKNRLQMAIRPDYRVGLIGAVQVVDGREEAVPASAENFQRGMRLIAVLHHSDGGGGSGETREKKGEASVGGSACGN